MNIFALHEDPHEAAAMMGDQHVIKMILESAQMLCSVARDLGHSVRYKPTHIALVRSYELNFSQEFQQDLIC